MSSEFDDEFRGFVVPELLSTFGQQATYTPVGGDDRVIVVSITDRSVNRENRQGARVNEENLKTFCRFDDETGISNPRENDKLAFDSGTWRFLAVVQRDAAGIEIEWTRSQDIRPRK